MMHLSHDCLPCGRFVFALWSSWLSFSGTQALLRNPEMIMDMENGLLDTYFFYKEPDFHFHWRNYRETTTKRGTKNYPNKTAAPVSKCLGT